ncbi:MAG: hypothetical protein J2P17_14385 [Mycobacterium sp.]|nr:hypothetical protein [Mycobacterium sp.]
MSTTVEVPTNACELAAAIVERQGRDGAENALYNALIEQEGQERGHSLWKQACVIVDHDAEVEAQNDTLARSIESARDLVRAAQGALTALTQGSETEAGTDIAAFLAEAGRALRAAEALMPEPK